MRMCVVFISFYVLKQEMNKIYIQREKEIFLMMRFRDMSLLFCCYEKIKQRDRELILLLFCCNNGICLHLFRNREENAFINNNEYMQ